MSRFVGRENLRKRLSPLEGESGRTRYADGLVQIEHAGETLIARPPFGLAHEGEYNAVRLAPLFDELAKDHLVGALLVRLGGYAVGVFDGERLVASKVGSRFVKGRHKKGGRSANRFRRRREGQAQALVNAAAETAAELLEPWRNRVEFVALGGHRATVDDVLAANSRLDWVAERALPRFFTVAEPRQRVLERLPYELYAVELSSVDDGPDDD
jgi:hypothetical protein